MMNTQDLDSPLKICKNCQTPKESIIETFGKKIKVAIMCKCEEEQYNEMKKEDENRQRMLKLEKLRNHSLMDSKFQQCTFENFEIDQSNKQYFNIAKRYTDRFEEMKKKI